MHRIHRIVTIAAASLAFAVTPAAAVPSDLRTEAARAGIDVVSRAAVPQDVRSPDARDGTGTRTPVATDPVIVRVSEPSVDGISWDSAAVGGLIASGLLIALAGGGTLVTRRRVHSA